MMPYPKAQQLVAKGATFSKKSNWYTCKRTRHFYVREGSDEKYLVYVLDSRDFGAQPQGWFTLKEVEEAVFERPTQTIMLFSHRKGNPKVRKLCNIDPEFYDALLVVTREQEFLHKKKQGLLGVTQNAAVAEERIKEMKKEIRQQKVENAQKAKDMLHHQEAA